MIICFIDESGTAPKRTEKDPPPYFVLGSIIVHEATWKNIAKEFRDLKEKPEYNIKGEIKWRFFSPSNKDRDNSVRHLSQAQRDKFRREMYEIITKRKSVKIIACISKVQEAYKLPYVKDDKDLYAYTYKPVSERFQYYLQDMTRTVGQEQRGIIVADHRAKNQDDHIRSLHHSVVEGDGAFTSKYENYIETVFLTPSHLSVGIQFADMVAGAIGRYFNSKDDFFFRIIESSFRQSDKGNIEGFGLVKFPSRGW